MARFNYDIRRRKLGRWVATVEQLQARLSHMEYQEAIARRERDEAQRRAYIAETTQWAFAQNVKLTPSSLKFTPHVVATLGEHELLRTILREVVSRWDEKMHRAIMDVARQARTLKELREVLAPWVTLEGFEPWEEWR